MKTAHLVAKKLNPFSAHARLFAIAIVGAAIAATATLASASVGQKPDALLQIDLNRSAVVEKIIGAWGKEIPAAQSKSFKEKLMGLRADQLLAANLSGSFDGVLEVINAKEVSAELTAASASAARTGKREDVAKLLGDFDKDLVYVPISTCRFVETRNIYTNPGTIAHFGAGQFAANEIRNYALGTACGFPAGVSAVVGQVLGQATAGAGANIEATRSGGGFGGGVTVVAANSPIFTVVSSAIPVNLANNSIAVHTTVNSAHVVIDVTGYFIRPQATQLDCEYWVADKAFGTASGYNFVQSNACSAGYTLLFSGCYVGSAGNVAGNYLQTTSPANPADVGSAARCEWYVGGNGFTGRANSRCCRIGGR